MPKTLTPEELAAFDAAPGLTPEQIAAFDAIPAPNAEGVQSPAQEAAPEPAERSTFAPEATLGAATRGFAQGGTFGFADELGGALGAVDEAARRAFGGGGVYEDKPLRQALVERYLLERNENRRELDAARAAHPVVTGAAELAGGLVLPMPGAGSVRAAAQAGKVGEAALRAAVAGAGMGALAGLGRTEESTLGGMAKDVGRDAAVGGLVMAPLGAGAAKVAAGKAKAAQDALELTQKKADQAMRSARSSLGAETSSGFRTLEQMERALEEPGADLAARQAALDFLTSPEGQALKNQVLESASRRGTGQLERIQLAEETFTEAAKATKPAAVQQATADYLSQGLKPEVLPRLSTVLTRAIPLAVGTSITGAFGGGPAGVAAGGIVGGVAALAMGSPGRTFANMIRSPRFRYGAASYAGPVLEAAAARGPAALASTYYLLHAKDPEVRAAAEAAAKDEEASK